MKRRSKWVKVLVSVLLSVVLMVQMTGVAWGDSLPSVKTLDLPIISQSKGTNIDNMEQCCWACCGTSVCQYYGSSITLDEFIFSIKYTYMHNVAGSITDTKGGMLMEGIDSDYYYDGVEETLGVLTFNECKSELAAGRPIVANSYMYYSTTQFLKHMILISGYSVYTGDRLLITDSFNEYPEYHLYSELRTTYSVDKPYCLQGCLYNISR